MANPASELFDYLPPMQACSPTPGVRVRVPFRNGERCGVLVEVAGESAFSRDRLRRVGAVLDQAPLLPEDHLDFLRWAADYYHYPLGEVVLAALPERLRRGEAPIGPAESRWQLTASGAEFEPAGLNRAPRQAEVLRVLQEHAEGVAPAVLRERLGECRQPLRALAAKGLIELLEFAPTALEAAPRQASDKLPDLNAAQASAVTQVSDALGRFQPFLLNGVTGSGKTEVYLRLVAETLDRGESALVLVPEIALTPQLVGRFMRRLGDGLSVLHSGMAAGERERAWRAAAEGRHRVIIGTRSAVLVPVPDLGLVIVDEEHDLSFKQQEGFRYSARDLAVVRASRAAAGNGEGAGGCPVVLGSATPSLESLHNVAEGRYRELRLPTRAGGAKPPRLDLIDIRDQPLPGGLSIVLRNAVAETLAAEEQVLLFLNRRGFAPVLSCYSCGWLSDCPRCDARQTLHAASQLLWCHHCGSQRRTPKNCPECGSEDLHPLGHGTERLEQNLRTWYPDVPILRVDRDATRRKGSLESLLAEARRGGPGILVGTQMLAKGHHLPLVTLVGVLDADGGLFGADFRSAERMAQMVLQVAGRAGRGERQGRVLIQTRHPEHPLLQTLLSSGYDGFAGVALAERQAAALPPYSNLLLWRAEAGTEGLPMTFLHGVADRLRGAQVQGIQLWGPVPAPMERRGGRYRAHLLVQSAERKSLRQLLRRMGDITELGQIARKVRWSLDVDPQEMF